MRKRAIPLKHYFLADINAVIRFLILSELVLSGAAGLLGPIFAIFISDFIAGSNEAVIGIAAGLYLISKSILQIPIAEFIDRVKGEKDDFFFMFTFTLLIALMPISYLFINTPMQLYIVQGLTGLFAAFTFPSFMAIFTRHIDKEKEGTEWGIYFTLNDIASAILAVVGGYIAATFGFHILISIVVALSIIGALMLLFAKPYLNLK